MKLGHDGNGEAVSPSYVPFSSLFRSSVFGGGHWTPLPQLSISSFGGLRFGHFRTTEKRQKGRHLHSVADIGRASVPS